MLLKSAQVQVPYHFNFAPKHDAKRGSIVTDKVQCLDVNWTVSFESTESEGNDGRLIFAFECVDQWDITMNLTASCGVGNKNLCIDRLINVSSSHVEVVMLPEIKMETFLECKSIDILLSLNMSESGCTPLQWWNELPNCITLKIVPDMSILVGDKSIPVHKSIISANSNVFASMLNSDMSESVSNQLHITDFSYDIVKSFLRCIYDGNCVDTELTHYVEQLLVIANKYEVMSLFQKAEKYLISTLTVDNVISLLCLADLHNSQLLKSEAMQVLADNSVHVLQNVNLSEVLSPVLCNEFILFSTGTYSSLSCGFGRKWREITDDTVCPKNCKLIVSLLKPAEDDEDCYTRLENERLCGEYCYIGSDDDNYAWFAKPTVHDDGVGNAIVRKYSHGDRHYFELKIELLPNDRRHSCTYFEVDTTEHTTMPIGVFDDYVIKCYQRK